MKLNNDEIINRIHKILDEVLYDLEDMFKTIEAKKRNNNEV